MNEFLSERPSRMLSPTEIRAYKMDFMAATTPPLRQEILSYYNNGQEVGRLDDRLYTWEKMRTLDLLSIEIGDARSLTANARGARSVDGRDGKN